MRFIHINFIIGTWSLITAVLNGSANTGTFKAAIFIVPSMRLFIWTAVSEDYITMDEWRRNERRTCSRTITLLRCFGLTELFDIVRIIRCTLHDRELPVVNLREVGNGLGHLNFVVNEGVNGKWDDQLREFWEEGYFKFIEIM